MIENEPFTEKDEFEESFDVVVREGEDWTPVHRPSCLILLTQRRPQTNFIAIERLYQVYGFVAKDFLRVGQIYIVP